MPIAGTYCADFVRWTIRTGTVCSGNRHDLLRTPPYPTGESLSCRQIPTATCSGPRALLSRYVPAQCVAATGTTYSAHRLTPPVNPFRADRFRLLHVAGHGRYSAGSAYRTIARGCVRSGQCRLPLQIGPVSLAGAYIRPGTIGGALP